MHQITCPVCGRTVESKRPKTFCSVKCRANSPDFIEVAKKNAVKARANKKASTRCCLFCGHRFKCQPAKTNKYCSRICYTRYRRLVFDDYVAALDAVPRLSNFDEFLDRDILDCPLCQWEGEDLGHHISMGHGIPAVEFKKKAGFNKSVGLVGRAYWRRLSLRDRNTAGIEPENRGRGPKKGVDWSPQAEENYRKAMALRKVDEE